MTFGAAIPRRRRHWREDPPRIHGSEHKRKFMEKHWKKKAKRLEALAAFPKRCDDKPLGVSSKDNQTAAPEACKAQGRTTGEMNVRAEPNSSGEMKLR